MSKELMDYFIRETNKRFDLIHDDLKEIRDNDLAKMQAEIHKLSMFRMKVVMISTATAAVVGFLVEIAVSVMK